MPTPDATAPDAALTLFDHEDLIEWVVEVDEILLRSTGAQDRAAMEWWAIQSGRPGKFTTVLPVVRPDTSQSRRRLRESIKTSTRRPTAPAARDPPRRGGHLARRLGEQSRDLSPHHSRGSAGHHRAGR